LNNQLTAREKYFGFYNTLLPEISGEALLLRVPHSGEMAKCRNASHFGVIKDRLSASYSAPQLSPIDETKDHYAGAAPELLYQGMGHHRH
jgi:hypothetical protein